jgi:hypothetical protein
MIADIILVGFYFYGPAIRIIGISLVVLLAPFDVISIISIFKIKKLIEQKEEEKLRKSARLLKYGSIGFWLAGLIFYPMMGFLGIETILALAAFYTVLLGTSVSSIAYINFLYKDNKLSLKKAVVLTITQLLFIFDFLGMLYLSSFGKKTYNPKVKRSFRDILRFFLGSLSYTPPEFWKVAANAIKRGPVPAALKKTGSFLTGQWRNHRVRSSIILAVLLLIPVGNAAYKFYLSRLPQLIKVGFRVQVPGTTGNPEDRPDLAVIFRGSAATVEMMDSEVPEGMITINPPIEGTWRWHDDAMLVFTTEQNWKIGKKYTVTFAKDFFPSHINVDGSFNFEIEDFNLRITEAEFYIDPEDSAIKRTLFTIATNYPLDTSSLEKTSPLNRR